MRSDPFSDILRLTNARSLVTGGFTAGGPWAIRFPAPSTIKFFAVVKGQCWASIDGEPKPTRFETGDVGLLVATRAFTLGNLSVPIAEHPAREILARETARRDLHVN